MRLLWSVLALTVCAAALASAVDMSEDLEAEVIRTSKVQSGRSRHKQRAKVTPGQIFMNGATVFLRTSRRGHYLSVGAFGELFGDSEIKGEFEEFRLFQTKNMPQNPARYVIGNSHDLLLDFGQEVSIYCVHSGKWLYVQAFDMQGRLVASADTADLNVLANRTKFRILRNQPATQENEENAVLSAPENNRIALQSVFNDGLLQFTSQHAKFSLAMDYSQGENAQISNRHLVSFGLPDQVPENAHTLPECGFEIQPAYTVY